MTWETQCADKLVSAEEAIDIIKPRDQVFTAGLTGTPFTVCEALVSGKERLRGLRLNTLAVSYTHLTLPPSDLV